MEGAEAEVEDVQVWKCIVSIQGARRKLTPSIGELRWNSGVSGGCRPCQGGIQGPGAFPPSLGPLPWVGPGDPQGRPGRASQAALPLTEPQPSSPMVGHQGR